MDISTNGDVVWVNSEQGCIGRFCKLSYEFVNPFRQDMVVKQAESGSTGLAEWRGFCKAMQTFHHVEVSDNFIPERLR